MTPQSGFLPGTVVTDPRYLFGSHRAGSALERLCRHLSVGTSCQVLGERRAGKTSILSCCLARLTSASPNHVSVLPDTRGLKTERDLYGSLVMAVHISFANHVGTGAPKGEVRVGQLVLPLSATASQLREAIDSVASRDLPMIFGGYVDTVSERGWGIVLLLDEYEALIDKCFGRDVAGFWPIHKLVERAPKEGLPKPLTLALAGSVDWGVYCELHGSPPLNFVAETVRAEPLSTQDFQEMWQSCLSRCTPDEGKIVETIDPERVCDLAGGWPFYGKVIGQHILADDTLDEERVAEALRPHFQVIWRQRSEDERQVLLNVVAGGAGENLSELIRRGLIERSATGTPRLRGRLWERWVSAKNTGLSRSKVGQSPPYLFRREKNGKMYRVRYQGGEEFAFVTSLGIEYIAVCLRAQRDMTAVEIETTSSDRTRTPTRVDDGCDSEILDRGDSQLNSGRKTPNRDPIGKGRNNPAVDRPYVMDTEERVRELRKDIEEIEKREWEENPGELENKQRELDRILKVLKSSRGLGGRARELTKSPEQMALDRVRKNIDNAYDELAKSLPEMVSHLRDSISRELGRVAYKPRSPIDWAF